MSGAALSQAFQAVGELAETGRPALVAIDGRCGSGKTWLAGRLAERWPCQVVHMDDFYLPPDRRASDWTEKPAGNMDLERLRTEVLAPARAGTLRAYRPFDCQSGAFLPEISLPDCPLLVLEGSYAHHPALAVPGLKIFLTCSRKEQERRLRLREGERFPAFETRWIPMEERYYRACGVPEADALVVETDGLFDLN